MDDDDTTYPSIDDELEATRGASTQPVGNHPLPEDNDSPATPPPSSLGNDLPDDHPATDTNLDSDEVYDVGKADAAETGGINNDNLRRAM